MLADVGWRRAFDARLFEAMGFVSLNQVQRRS
jgi:hypothetical protein